MPVVTGSPPVRTAHLVLADPGGRVLGRLPPIDLPDPWWSEVASLVDAVRARDGLAITILRLLAANGQPPGGTLTYLAELAGPPPALAPWTGDAAPHAHTPAFARSGGPAGDLAWPRPRWPRTASS